jgi:phosphatidylserine/phosphatidylglycerophosphate/cardiolipin synthase-like enzyme
MAEGIKLYSQFVSFLKERSKVKIAWFTTFNLSISFFERYILSALANTDYKSQKSLKDYEALNQRLFCEEKDSINIKVFHDFRAMRPEVKRTSVTTVGVNPQELDLTFQHGVFHPKVILVVDEEDNGWIITGSMNLSTSAWTSNSECVAFRKIEDKKNAKQIIEFFRRIVKYEEDVHLLDNLSQKWQEELVEESNWIFQHSLNGPIFIDQFPLENKSLHVWSPYFSDDIPEIIESTFSAAKEVHIIPDHSDKDEVKISNVVVEQLIDNKRVKFFKDQHDYGDYKPTVHAKVWLTEDRLAIGSWNFTNAGLNIKNGRANIEAGIIQAITPSDYQEIIQSSSLEIKVIVKGIEQNELQEERHQLIHDWTMSCEIIADWELYIFRAQYSETTDAQNFFVELPGFDKRIPLNELTKGISFKDQYRSVLKDRIFSVYNDPFVGKRKYMGIITELKASERPSIGFESMNDLIRAWSDGRPENKDSFQGLNYPNDMETGDELQKSVEEKLKGDYSQAWFSMFLAFEHMKSRLQEAKDNPKECRIIGYKMPGSIIQLKEHLVKLKEKHATEESEISDPYLWFLIEEANQIIGLYNKQIHSELIIESIEQITIRSEVNEKKLTEWLTFIKKECDYLNG